MSEKYGKLFIESVTAEIRSHWLWEMTNALPSGYGPSPPTLTDSGLKRIVSDFVNSFCQLNGASVGTSQEEFLDSKISNIRSQIIGNDSGKRFYFGLFTEMVVNASFEGENDHGDGTLAKRYLSTVKIPDHCKHSSWRNFDNIYDEYDNLKPEYRTEAEIKMDDKYTEAGRAPGKRKRKESKNGASSHNLNIAQDLCINPVVTTVEEVFGTKVYMSGASKDARRQAWWDRLIGPETRKRICRF